MLEKNMDKTEIPKEKKVKTLSDLKEITKEEKEENISVKKEPEKDKLGRSYATGKRKLSIARVWIKRGSGKIEVNGKNFSEYFGRDVLQMIVESPFKITERKSEFDVSSSVHGGGLSGQAGALRHGISQALVRFEPELRPKLKTEGLLTRDSRVVERKKYGRAKARRSFQFSKR